MVCSSKRVISSIHWASVCRSRSFSSTPRWRHSRHTLPPGRKPPSKCMPVSNCRAPRRKDCNPPPAMAFFSNTVTRQPSRDKSAAVNNPPKPPPTTTISGGAEADRGDETAEGGRVSISKDGGFQWISGVWNFQKRRFHRAAGRFPPLGGRYSRKGAKSRSASTNSLHTTSVPTSVPRAPWALMFWPARKRLGSFVRCCTRFAPAKATSCSTP